MGRSILGPLWVTRSLLPSQASNEEAIETAALPQVAGQGAHIARVGEIDGQTLELWNAPVHELAG